MSVADSSRIDSSFTGQRYLFVTGLMRSGTTLLYRLLNSHPQISLLFEADLFTVRPLLWTSRRGGVWSERLDFWNGTLRRHGLAGDVVPALPLHVRGSKEALECLGQAYARRKPGSYIGEKSIHYCNQLPSIAQAFPAARFVVIWRPLAEILDSLRRAGETNLYLSPRRRARQLLQQYGELAEGVLALRRARRAVHELGYAELIEQPEAVCRELCDFLGLSWSPTMLAQDRVSVAAVPAEAHHFRALHNPPGSRRTQPLQISAHTLEKVQSYEHYWSVKYGGQPVRMALRAPLLPQPALRFFTFRRWVDHLSYRLHRTVTFSKLVVYRFAPLTLLKAYRAKRRPANTLPCL